MARVKYGYWGFFPKNARYRHPLRDDLLNCYVDEMIEAIKDSGYWLIDGEPVWVRWEQTNADWKDDNGIVSIPKGMQIVYLLTYVSDTHTWHNPKKKLQLEGV